MKKISLILALALVFLGSIAHAEVFKWIDEKGGVHFTEDWERIPEKYRDQVKRREMPEDSTAPEEKTKRTGSQREFDISVSYKGRDTGYHIFYIRVKNNGTRAKRISPSYFMLTEEDNRTVDYTFPSMALRNQMPQLDGITVLPGGFVDGYLFYRASKRGKTLIYTETGEEFSVR